MYIPDLSLEAIGVATRIFGKRTDRSPLEVEAACSPHYSSLESRLSGVYQLELYRTSDERGAVFVALQRRIAPLGGRLTEGWRSTFGDAEGGARTVDRLWPAVRCSTCRRGRLDEVA